MKGWGAIAGSLLAIASGCGRPEPVSPPPSEITDFQFLFAANCAACHGAEGRGGAAQELHNALYLALVPREELQKTVESGRPGTPMPAFARSEGGPLYPKQITALVDGMKRIWGQPVDLKGKELPPYRASGGDPALGKTVFAAACAPCHNEKSRIGPVVNQSYLALVSDQGLRTTVIVGRPNLGMPEWRNQPYHGGLTEADISNVVGWLASQRSPLAQGQRERQAGPHEFEGGRGPANPGQHGEEGNMGSGSSSIQGGPGLSGSNRTVPDKRQ